jgi:MFS family permease
MIRPKDKINYLYAATFLLNLHIAVISYINSTFLNGFFNDHVVGLLYSLGAILSIWAFIALPEALSRYGNYQIGLWALAVEFLAIFSLGLTQNPVFIFVSFVASLILIRIIGLNSDIFLESLSTNGETGDIRGRFLTASNLAWVFSPLIASLLIGESNYEELYIFSALLALPVLYIFATKFRGFIDPLYKRITFWASLRLLKKKPDVSKVFTINTMLQIFYSWMIIYTPMYLKEYIGFEWSEIGLIFTIMLLPFVLFEIPLGRLADKTLGEKEIMSLGIVILSVTTICLSFIEDRNLVLWTIMLFLTRVGASAIEIMNETYFFKKINHSDSDLIEFFRMTSPIAYILGPAMASLILFVIDIKYMFLVLGVMMVWGLRYSLTIKDTL